MPSNIQPTNPSTSDPFNVADVIHHAFRRHGSSHLAQSARDTFEEALADTSHVHLHSVPDVSDDEVKQLLKEAHDSKIMHKPQTSMEA
jgi:signal transduction histidine kinase